jgi:hypothetical protein
MERKDTDGARTRRLSRNWAGVATILSLTQLFAVAGPLWGQTPSGRASDPFAVLQQSLEAAADEQLVLGPGQPVANHDSRAAVVARPGGGEFSFNQEEGFVSGGRLSAEQRFLSLGVDAGAIFREFGVPVSLLKIAQVESNWKPLELSPKGALTQVSQVEKLLPAETRAYVPAVRGETAGHDGK